MERTPISFSAIQIGDFIIARAELTNDVYIGLVFEKGNDYICVDSHPDDILIDFMHMFELVHRPDYDLGI